MLPAPWQKVAAKVGVHTLAHKQDTCMPNNRSVWSQYSITWSLSTTCTLLEGCHQHAVCMHHNNIRHTTQQVNMITVYVHYTHIISSKIPWLHDNAVCCYIRESLLMSSTYHNNISGTVGIGMVTCSVSQWWYPMVNIDRSQMYLTEWQPDVTPCCQYVYIYGGQLDTVTASISNEKRSGIESQCQFQSRNIYCS